MGNLGLFDPSNQDTSKVKAEDDDDDEEAEEPEPSITTFKIHTRTISAFQFHPTDPQSLYSASYDSSIRRLDLAKGVAVEAYAPTDKDIDEPLSGVQIAPADPTTLYFTTLNGSFGRHDTRTPMNPQNTDIFALSDKKIGGFSLHPALPHFVATASLDRFMKLWDLRKINGKGEWRIPALVGEHESRLSVSHAAFNSAGQIATASYDDTIKIYNFEDMKSWAPGKKSLSEEEMKPAHVVRHNNQTGRWVTM